MEAGLVKGEGFAVDASIIKADASRQRGVPGNEQVNWNDPAPSTRAVRKYLEALDEEALAESLPKRLIFKPAGPQLQVAQRFMPSPRII
jgi:hypothetical protein